MKKYFILWVTIILWLVLHQNIESLAQGREWTRIRAGTAYTGEVPIDTETEPVEYHIAPSDQLEIFVWRNPDLTKEVIVAPDGKISYPLVGRVKVDGMTLDELEDILEEKLSKFIRNPQISVMVTKITGNRFVVLGEVVYPGIYSYTGRINLLEAIGLAGDFTPDARRDSVLIVRRNEDGSAGVIRVNAFHALRRGMWPWEEKYIIHPRDVIYVPRTFIGDFKKFMNDIEPMLTQIDKMIGVRPKITEEMEYWKKWRWGRK